MKQISLFKPSRIDSTGQFGGFEFDEKEKNKSLPDVIKIMDNAQETLARSLGDGHRIIHGVAGSGKTLILEYRAKKLAEEPKNKKVLILCFNILLASRLRGRLPHENIEVLHFHGWLTQLRDKFDIKIPKSNNYIEALETTIITAIDNNTIPNGLYDAILIDEGHDFASEWLSATVKMVNPEHDNLFLLYDDAQSIYDNRKGIDFTLSSVGIEARGRTTILRLNYRNSKEILQTADKFIHHFLKGNDEVDEENIPFLSPQFGGIENGIPPEFDLFKNQDDEFEYIFNKLKQWQSEGVDLKEIAVLHHNNKYADKLNNYLECKSITTALLKDKKQKENYLPKSDVVTLCTIHSSKGSEFSHVILADLGNCSEKEQEKTAKLIYVGMTRAMNELIMTASSSNTYTKKIVKLLES